MSNDITAVTWQDRKLQLEKLIPELQRELANLKQRDPLDGFFSKHELHAISLCVDRIASLVPETHEAEYWSTKWRIAMEAFKRVYGEDYHSKFVE